MNGRTWKKKAYALAVVIGFVASTGSAITVIPVSSSAELSTALNSISEGDVIEMADGTYPVPAGGFLLSDAGVNCTIRAAEGALVTLDGGGNSQVFRMENSVVDVQHTVVFENLVFADGLSNDSQLGGGVTLIQAAATFSGCTFLDNSSIGDLTGGGGVFMRDFAVGHFFDCTFSGNTAMKEGGAMRLRNNCMAIVHDCFFSYNRTDVPDHHYFAEGGAIHLYDSSIWISNSTFYQNYAGCIGGAIYVKGIYDETPNPTSSIIISNSTFDHNRAEPDPSSYCSQATVGGAMLIENDAVAEIYSSRFLENAAEMGGALGDYRGRLTIEDSVFKGNLAFGDDGNGAGGALHSNSNDTLGASTNDGEINRPSAVITIRNSLFQGRWGATERTANKGACIYTRGDSNRTYGIVVPQDGTAAENRTVLTISDSAFIQCDSGYTDDADGGAMALNHTQLYCTDCMFLDNDAGGDTGDGGAMRLTVESNAVISDSWFQDNQAGNRSGVFMVSGSDLEVDHSVFFNNVVRSLARGNVLWSTSTAATNTFPAFEVHGHINNSYFLLSNSLNIQETDFAEGPVNDLTYAADYFLTDPPEDIVFNSSINPGYRDVPDLNDFVAVRNAGVGDTDKAPDDDNVALTSLPALGKVLAIPDQSLGTAAPGDVTPTESYVVAAWIGGPATMDGVELTGDSGWYFQPADSGTHTLDVENGEAGDSATIYDGPVPSVWFEADPPVIGSGEYSSLQWASTSGDWLGVSIDRGISIPNPLSSGSVDVSPGATESYLLFSLCKQGGVVKETTIWVDEEPPDTLFFDGFESGDTGRWFSSTGD